MARKLMLAILVDSMPHVQLKNTKKVEKVHDHPNNQASIGTKALGDRPYGAEISIMATSDVPEGAVSAQ